MPRGRPKGSKTRTPSETTATAAPAAQAGPGHNANGGITDEQQAALFLQHLRQITALKEKLASVNGDLRNAYKRARADQFSKKDIDFALELEKDEDDTMIEERRRQEMIARWLNHPIGTQGSLFDNVDRTPAIDKAYADGKRVGMEGKSGIAPYDASSEQAQAWMRGWHEGQRALFAITPKGAEPPIVESAEDDFDEALSDAESGSAASFKQELRSEIAKGDKVIAKRSADKA